MILHPDRETGTWLAAEARRIADRTADRETADLLYALARFVEEPLPLRSDVPVPGPIGRVVPPLSR